MEMDGFGGKMSGALKPHIGNQCEYSSKNSSHLRTLSRCTVEKSHICVISVTMRLLMLAILEDILLA